MKSLNWSLTESALAAILLIALVLRLTGIAWGLPNALHLFSYHVDETVMVTASTPDIGGLNFFAGKFLPHYYNYGSLPFYLDYFAIAIGEAYHWIGPIVVSGQLDPANWARAYLAARLLSVAMGVGTVWATYAVGRQLWGRKAGPLAALILAVAPLHVQHSHFATVDVGSAFWVVLSLLWSSKLIDSTEKLKCVLLAGLFAGLSAATKYSGGLVLLSLVVPLITTVRRGDLPLLTATKLVFAGCVAALLAFMIACPGCIFDTALFWQGLHDESDHVMHHGEIAFMDTGIGWVYIVTRNLAAGLGWPLLILSLAGTVCALLKHTSKDALLAAFALPLYLILGAAQSRYARYEIPLLPILALWSGNFVVTLMAIERVQKGILRISAAVVSVFILAFTLFYDATLLAPMTKTDNRDRAAIWLQNNVPQSAPIAFGSQPWFWTPSINPYFAMPKYGAWKQATPPDVQALYLYNPELALDPAILLNDRPKFVVLSEYEYDDPLRLKQPGALQYIGILRRQYDPPLVFASEHRLGGRSLVYGLPTQDLPHDMLYPNPTTLIFVRRPD